MTHRCPDCGRNLRHHLDGGDCGILRRNGQSRGRRRA